MPIKTIKRSLVNILKSGTSPHKLALTFAVGMYIAFSPFPGFHTLMMLALYRLMQLNLPLIFIVVSFNNPWTMIPLYAFDYSVGYWVIHRLLNLEPLWHFDYVSWFNYFHISLPISGSFCIVSFLVGGNIIAILAALISYPIVKRVSERLHKH